MLGLFALRLPMIGPINLRRILILPWTLRSTVSQCPIDRQPRHDDDGWVGREDLWDPFPQGLLLQIPFTVISNQLSIRASSSNSVDPGTGSYPSADLSSLASWNNRSFLNCLLVNTWTESSNSQDIKLRFIIPMGTGINNSNSGLAEESRRGCLLSACL